MVITSKRGNLDNVMTYEHICDFTSDMANIDPHYITLGSVCTVINGEGGLELYIADSEKQWHPIMTGGGESGNNDDDEQGGGSGSKEELLIEKTIQLPVDSSMRTPFIYTYDLTAEECDNVLMNLESSDDGGKCHIEILGDNDFYYHVDFICHSIVKTNSGTKIYFYMSKGTSNDLYLTVDKYEIETPPQYSLAFLNLSYENAYSLLNSITIRISKIID